MKNNKMLTLLLIIILFGILIFILIKNINKDSNEVKDNQIIYKNISEEEVAEIYFYDFINTINIDVNEGYKLLNNKVSYEEYLDFISLIDENILIKSYKIKKTDDYKLFYIKDNSDRTYIFKENSIMNYTVYLDEKDI